MAIVRARVAIVVVCVAVLAVSACGSDTMPFHPLTPARSSPSSTCRDGSLRVDLTVPDPTQIRLNVLNASGVEGLALKVFVELGQRGFQMLSTTEDYPDPRDYPEAAVIRYGPRTVGAGWLLSFYFHGKVRTQFNAQRTDDRVDVILGKAYTNLSTPPEVNRAAANAGLPTAPAGACGTGG